MCLKNIQKESSPINNQEFETLVKENQTLKNQYTEAKERYEESNITLLKENEILKNKYINAKNNNDSDNRIIEMNITNKDLEIKNE